MGRSTRRSILGALAASAFYVGIWAEFLPESFYRSFPGFGRHWIPVLGPYNDHLVRDVGGLYLALGVVSVGALWATDVRATLWVAVAWEAFSVPHLVFHLFHLDPYATLDQVLNVVLLGAAVVAPAALLRGCRTGAVTPGVTGEMPDSKARACA